LLVGNKQKNVERHEINAKGDQYVFIGMAGTQKATVSWGVGKFASLGLHREKTGETQRILPHAIERDDHVFRRARRRDRRLISRNADRRRRF
jgi:hypothetical protein